MGNRFAVPETDAGMAQCMKFFELTKKDVRHLWEGFLRVDKMHTGMCNLDDLCRYYAFLHRSFFHCFFHRAVFHNAFSYLKYSRNGFIDTVFDLLDIEQGKRVGMS